MKLDVDKKAAIFRNLASASLYDVGVQFGLDKHYKNVSGVRSRVYQIYREVSNDPEKFSVHPETVELVVNAVSNRNVAVSNAPTLAEAQAQIKENDIKNLTTSSRDSAGRLIRSKLAYLEDHPKALAAESLVTLGKIFGILFDKAQIIQGQATEHVAVMSKIDSNMTPEQALEAVLRSRETMMGNKYE